ncbi:hypothetical protein SNEBB_008653 [Seison nebaliae]|nr:hypothetical protein SNEBB_008653 [Seison nebaliae]
MSSNEFKCVNCQLILAGENKNKQKENSHEEDEEMKDEILEKQKKMEEQLHNKTLVDKIECIANEIFFNKLCLSGTMCQSCVDCVIKLLGVEIMKNERNLSENEKLLNQLSLTNHEHNQEEELSKLLSEEIDDYQYQIQNLENDIDDATEKLNRLIEEEKSLKDGIEQVRKENMERRREIMEGKYELQKNEEEKLVLSKREKLLENELRLLQKMNMFNSVFNIWFHGEFGTINNYRLGRLPNEKVEWSEISAAMGECALLLQSLANRQELVFERYQLIPFGNRSYLIKSDNGEQLPLYVFGGSLYVWDTKLFNQAMCAFLDCLKQLEDSLHSERYHHNYRINVQQGQIEETFSLKSFSVKMLVSEEKWTKAMKMLLTKLKWCICLIGSDDTSKVLINHISSNDNLLGNPHQLHLTNQLNKK